MNDVIRAEAVAKTFIEDVLSVDVLRRVDIVVRPADTIAIVGASGAGKSTLLHLLAGLDQPTSGRIWVDGQDMGRLSEAERGRVRNRILGFVYQFHHLLQEFTALENVAMPLLIRREPVRRAHQRAQAMLKRVGLADRALHKPSELSGGERQRVAIARALANDPSMLLCDEPTGNLDSANSDSVMKIFDGLNEEGVTIIVVTHNPSVADHASRIVTMRDGKLLGEVGE